MPDFSLARSSRYHHFVLQLWEERGTTVEVHAGDVRELIGRGWAEEGSGVIQITSAGRQVRAEVEAETERLFFAPWLCLNGSELEELSNLASQLRDGLKKLEDK